MSEPRRVRLLIEYDGGAYCGWQRQLNALSVQQVLEEALRALTKAHVVLIGASRTDAGVHALGQVAHFDTTSPIPDEKIAFALNPMLPRDIRVLDSAPTAPDFHARYHATCKLYRYLIHNAPHASALYRNRRAHVMYPLNIEAMRAEALDMLGTHDFAAFAASGSAAKSTVRTVDWAEVSRDGKAVKLLIHGNGFLYNMVRIFAGTLILVGAGKLERGAIKRAITSGSRLDLGVTAPAHGLTLMRVEYD